MGADQSKEDADDKCMDKRIEEEGVVEKNVYFHTANGTPLVASVQVRKGWL